MMFILGGPVQSDFTIGDLSKRVDVNIDTIRYYERIGLMPKSVRTKGGRRTYRNEEVNTLAFIRNARELGFHIEDIRSLLRLRGPSNECTDVKAIAQRHLDTVRAEMRRVAEVERLLSAAVSGCPGGATAGCTVLRLLERAT